MPTLAECPSTEVESASTALVLPPEPAQLYLLAVMAFQMHVPNGDGRTVVEVCALCRDPWPCDQARLAFRNCEAF